MVSETAAVIDEASPLSRSGLYNLDPARRGFGYGVDGAMTRICSRSRALPASHPAYSRIPKSRAYRALLRLLQRRLRQRARPAGR